MEIKIKDKGSSNYYDEFLFITSNYKKIYSNNKIKIKRLTLVAYKYLIISLSVLIIFIFMYLKYSEIMQLYTIIMFLILLVLSIIYIYIIKKKISELAKSFEETTLVINNNYICLENKNKKYKLKLDDIKNIVLSKNCILFIPNDIQLSFIVTRRDYEDEIMIALKKYNKEQLINK